MSGSDSAYWHELHSRWDGKEDLVVVEHDMVPAYNVIDEMQSCGRKWCTSPYLIGGRLLIEQGLGCTRFSKELQQELPDAIWQAGEPKGEQEPPRAWWTIDHRLNHVLRKAGVIPHTHQQSIHLHD